MGISDSNEIRVYRGRRLVVRSLKGRLVRFRIAGDFSAGLPYGCLLKFKDCLFGRQKDDVGLRLSAFHQNLSHRGPVCESRHRKWQS